MQTLAGCLAQVSKWVVGSGVVGSGFTQSAHLHVLSTTSQCLQWGSWRLATVWSIWVRHHQSIFFRLKKKREVKTKQQLLFYKKMSPHCEVDSVELQILVNIFTPSFFPCQDIFMPFNLSAENSWRQLTVSNRLMIAVIGHWLGSFNCTKYSIMSVKVWEL